ncbi:type VI secretion system-associated protein TagF [Aquicoccus sp. SCR17]|nr:type VI secretion system-associated protein TagF [Carideicomes alvinocaridis]
MPALGDFFRLHPPAGFLEAWDPFLQALLTESAGVLGAEFDAAYMSAPIWRFTLAAGLAGPGPVMGVLMPSVDRVGRRFPLTLMVPLAERTDVAASHFREAALFAQLEDLALDMLEDSGNRDALEEGLAALPAPQPEGGGLLRAAAGTLVLSQGAGLQGASGDVAAALLGERYRAPSLWSTEVDGVPRLMVAEGLPGPREMLALITLHAPLWTEARPV